jgi:hypothetical protein
MMEHLCLVEMIKFVIEYIFTPVVFVFSIVLLIKSYLGNGE